MTTLVIDEPVTKVRSEGPKVPEASIAPRGDSAKIPPELTLDFDVAPLMTGDRDLGFNLASRDFVATDSSTDARGIGNWAHTPVTGHCWWGSGRWGGAWHRAACERTEEAMLSSALALRTRLPWRGRRAKKRYGRTRACCFSADHTPPYGLQTTLMGRPHGGRRPPAIGAVDRPSFGARARMRT